MAGPGGHEGTNGKRPRGTPAAKLRHRVKVVEIETMTDDEGGPGKVLVRALPIGVLWPLLKALFVNQRPSNELPPETREEFQLESGPKPGLGGKTLAKVDEKEPFEKTLERIADYQAPAGAIAQLGILEPKFDFETGPTDDVDVFASENGDAAKPIWSWLSFGDQTRIVNGILECSGMRGQETAPLRAFPDGDPGGRGGGEADGQVGEHVEVAVSGDDRS